MSLTRVMKDPATCRMTIDAEFDSSSDRIWQMWADPRLLERWWGPPSCPATVIEHDLRPGGSVTYYATDPEGNRIDGAWRVLAVDAPLWLEFDLVSPGLPVVRTCVDVGGRADGGARMRIEMTFPTSEAMDRMMAIGFDKGMSAAVGQIDDLQ